MSVPIANQDHGIQKMPNTATALPAGSTTPPRIDEFIARQFSRAKSEDFSGIKSTATRASVLGFKQSANSRYVGFLEAFRDTPELAARYADRYPACCFLPWRAFHQVLKSLQLWCELPEFYAGAIPESELTMLELFEGVRDEDQLHISDIRELIHSDHRVADLDLILARIIDPSIRYAQFLPDWRERHVATMARARREQLMELWTNALDSMFVVAPPEAFTTNEDWLSRFNRLITSVATAPTVAPNDPLVIRFVHGGALVIASWGDEGAWLNEAVKTLEGGA